MMPLFYATIQMTIGGMQRGGDTVRPMPDSDPPATIPRLDHADRTAARGWAAEPDGVEVFLDGRLLTTAAPGPFDVFFDPALPEDKAAWLAVRTPDGADVAGSPLHLPAAPALSAAALLPDRGVPVALLLGEATGPRPLPALAELARYLVLAGARANAHVAACAGRVRLAILHGMAAMTEAPALRAANPGMRVILSLDRLEHVVQRRRAWVLGGLPSPGLKVAELSAVRSADAVISPNRAVIAELSAMLPGLRAHLVPHAPLELSRPSAGPGPDERLGVALLECGEAEADRDSRAVWDHAVEPRLAALPVVSDWLQSRVVAAPWRFASHSGRVMACLRAGVACVCSPIAAEGLDLPARLIARDAADMAERLRRLHDDPHELATVLAECSDAVANLATAARALAWAI